MTPEQRHMGRIAALGCIVGRLGFTSECSGRTVVHHIRDGQGITDRADDFAPAGQSCRQAPQCQHSSG